VFSARQNLNLHYIGDLQASRRQKTGNRSMYSAVRAVIRHVMQNNMLLDKWECVN